MRKIPVLAVTVYLIGCMSLTLPVRGDEDGGMGSRLGPWLHLPDLPQSKEQFGLEACEGKIYAVAGICNGRETGSSFVYDTNNGQWWSIAPLPRAVQSPCLRAVNGQVFCFGGYDHRLPLKYNDVWVYDPNTDAWLPRCPMRVALEDAGSAVVGGQVWIIGGLTNPGHTLVARIDIYDPRLDAWVYAIGLQPEEGYWPGRALGDFACSTGEVIWCVTGTESMAGYPGLRPSTMGFSANEVTLEFVLVPDPRCYAEVEPIRDRLYVVGGCRTSTMDFADTMLIYNTQTRTWEEPVLLPYPARGQGACSSNGILYVAGGYDGSTRTDFCLWME